MAGTRFGRSNKRRPIRDQAYRQRGGDVATDTTTSTKSTKTATVKKGARITGAAREKLAADLRKKYEKGQSIRALAEGTGRSYGFVHRLLLDAEVPLRGRGGATRTKKK